MPNHLRNFPIKHPSRKKVEDLVEGRPMIEVPYKPKIPLKGCYWGVQDRIDAQKGSMILGWSVLWFEDVFVELYHHAIYADTKGKYVDITYRPSEADKHRFSTFIPDDSVQIDLSQPPLVDNKFLVLLDCEGARMFIEHSKRQLAIRREQNLRDIKRGKAFTFGEPARFDDDLARAFQEEYIAIGAAVELCEDASGHFDLYK